MLGFLGHLPPDSIIYLRRGLRTNAGPFEQLVSRLATTLGLSYRYHLPVPHSGRAAVYNRDIAMVAESDLVVAFFAPARIMEGGTAHVVEKAIDAAVPVFAYAIHQDGRIERVGEWEDPRLAEWDLP